MGVLGEDAAGGDDGALADAAIVEDGDAHADEAGILDHAAVDGGVVADGDPVADGDGVEIALAVEDGAVLYVGVGADADGMDVAAEDGVHPHRGVFAELDVAEDLGGRVNVAGGGNPGRAAVPGADHGGETSLKSVDQGGDGPLGGFLVMRITSTREICNLGQTPACVPRGLALRSGQPLLLLWSGSLTGEGLDIFEGLDECRLLDRRPNESSIIEQAVRAGLEVEVFG